MVELVVVAVEFVKLIVYPPLIVRGWDELVVVVEVEVDDPDPDPDVNVGAMIIGYTAVGCTVMGLVVSVFVVVVVVVVVVDELEAGIGSTAIKEVSPLDVDVDDVVVVLTEVGATTVG